MAHEADVLRQVAALHVEGLDLGFLSRLGSRFLRLLYRALDEDPDSVLLVEVRDGKVVGFVTGGSGMGPIYRRLLRRPLALSFALAPHLLNPALIRGIIELVRHRRRDDAQGGSGFQSLPKHELLSIVVAPAARGTGVADDLYHRLSKHFLAEDVSAFRIVVGAALVPAHRFYRRMGAEPVAQTQVHAGVVSTVFVQRLR
jgi:GNAT superfamily N-acetyltransferase